MSNNNHTPRVQSAALTDQGRRPNNEDAIAFFEPTDPKEREQSGYIYIVADGVGGASIGERASKFAAEKVLYEYLQHPDVHPATRLKQAIVKANREIFEYAEQNAIRMATTMTIAVILGDTLIAANVGDSRIYLIRNGKVKQVTEDHNVVGELVRSGAMSESAALKSKAKNKLTRSIGGEDEVQADTFEEKLQPGDKIFLCSDGLTRYALKEDIAKITTAASPKQIAADAIEFAKKRGHGGADNISVISVAYEPIELSPSASGTLATPEEDWEVRETEIDYKPRPAMPYFQIAVVTALFLFFIGTVGSVAYIYRDRILSFMQVQDVTPSSIVPVMSSTASPTTTNIPTVTNTATLTPTLTSTVVTETPGTLTMTPTPTLMETIAVTSTINPSTGSCLYVVMPGDYLSRIANKFEIGGNYRSIQCATSQENSACNLDNPANIRPGWQVLIPGVNPDVCSQNGGTPQP